MILKTFANGATSSARVTMTVRLVNTYKKRLKADGYQAYSIALNQNRLEMWANAQRYGRPVEYRWRTLFNAAKFG